MSNTEQKHGLRPTALLKRNARGYLAGRYFQVVPMQIIYTIFFSMASGLISLPRSSSMTAAALSLIFTLLALLLCGLLLFGRVRYFMNFCCGYRASLPDLFYGFRRGDNRPVLLSLIFTAYLFFSFLPGLFFLAMYLRKGLMIYVYLGLGLLALGLICFYMIYLGLSQCSYLILDFPEKSLPEIMKLSLYLMRGRRGRLFYMHLSFLPMLVLSLLSFGVGFLWTMPYFSAALTCFHLDLTREAAAR